MREAIVNELVEAVKEIAGKGYLVASQEIKKNNGVELQAVVIRQPGEVFALIIYVDRIVEEIEKEDMTIIEAALKVFSVYQEYKNQAQRIDIKKVTGKEYILANVEYQLVNAERNAERFQDVPGKKIADLVAIYRIVINNDEKGVATYVLRNKQLEAAGISIEELDEAAMRNTERTGFEVKTMHEVMAEMMGISDEMDAEMYGDPCVYVLSNSRKINGANILLYKEQLEKVAERIRDDFYILPSSIHELLAVSVSDADANQVKEMVKEVNDNEVDSQEILGYKVYRYNRETGEIEIVA